MAPSIAKIRVSFISNNYHRLKIFPQRKKLTKLKLTFTKQIKEDND